MAFVNLDVAYDSSEDFPAMMNTIEKEYNVTATPVKWVGPGGGWPEIRFEGERSDLARLITEKFDSGDDETNQDNIDAIDA